MRSPSLNSILLVDDDEISNLFNKIFIGKLDLSVDVKVNVALNGKEAIKLLNELAKDDQTPLLNSCLLLLDIKMPVMDGWEFLIAYERLFDEETKNKIVIVMLTTSEDEGDIIKAMDSPLIKDIIKKPLSEDKFNKLFKKFFLDEKAI